MSKAFTKYIGKNTSDSHQISPHWIVTFTRFNTRDTYNYGVGFQGADKEPTRKPLVVENDCISISVSTSKTNFTPNATITLVSGDLNYGTAIAPGDFVMINMVNSSAKARNIVERAFAEKPINKIGDGFKGVFKVNSVNKIVAVDPNTGVKILRYQVNAYGFTEFNNLVYYNPTLGNAINKDVLLYEINDKLMEVLNSKKDIQEVLELLPLIILGSGKINVGNSKIIVTKKSPYEIPEVVFKLLGLTGKYAIDLYKIMLGIWNPSGGGSLTEKAGLNPSYAENGSIQSMTQTLQGKIPIQTSPITDTRLTDLLKRYSNDLINEMYVCYRVDKDRGLVIPKFIIRQKPFNTEHGTGNAGTPFKGTRFLTLPRWKISADLIYSLNISKNESLRFNFVHIIGTTGLPPVDGALLANQNINKRTVRWDEDDIKRHGLRPYTKISNFDWPSKSKQNSLAPHWADLVWDWVYAGHLKANGTITCVGIEQDICIGDNLELQDTVYHIESITHTGSISPNGKKVFRTNLQLTHGVDKRSSSDGPVYPEMDYTDTLTDRKHDYKNKYGILPGFSDTQDILGRKDGEELKETKERTFTMEDIKEKQNNNDDN